LHAHHVLPWSAGGDTDLAQATITAATLPPNAFDRLDLGHAVAVLMQQAA